MLRTIREYTRKLAMALERARAGEYSVRDSAGDCLCDRGEPSGFADGALCFEGDGDSSGKDRFADYGGAEAEGAVAGADWLVARIWRRARTFFVKSPVFPWGKFPGVDTVLGPEMKSTGEVMGVADNFGEAFAKAQIAAGQVLPLQGTVFLSVNDHDKEGAVFAGSRLCGDGISPGGYARYGSCAGTGGVAAGARL